MSASHSLLKDLILYIPVKVIPAVAGVLLLFYLIRVLPGEQYVQYSVGMAVGLISMQLCSGWLPAPIVFFLPSSGNRDGFVYDVILLATLFALLSATFAAIAAIVVIRDIFAMIAISLMCFTQSISVALSAICQSERRIRLQMSMTAAASVLLLAGVVLSFIGLARDYRYVFVSYSLAYLFCIGIFIRSDCKVGGFLAAIKSNRSIKLNFKKVFDYGSPLSLWIASMLILNSGEKFFLSDSGASAGYLAVKDLLIGATSLLSMPLIMVMHPLILKIHRQSGDYWRMVVISVDLLSIVFGVSWCLFSVIGIDLLGAITGKEYQNYKVPIFIAFIAMYLSAVGVYYQKPLEVERKTRLLAGVSIIVAILALSAFAIFVPTRGIFAAAVIFFVAQFAYNIVLLLLRRCAVAIIRPLLFVAVFVVCGELFADILIRAQPIGSRGLIVGIWAASFLAISVVVAVKVASRLKGVGAELELKATAIGE